MEETQEDAVLALLKRLQSKRELKEVLEHMTLSGNQKIKVGDGESMLYNILDGDQLNKYLEWKWQLPERAEPSGPVRIVMNMPYQRRSVIAKAQELGKGQFA